MAVVEKIEAVPTTRRAGYQDVPETAIVIESVSVLED
jgi:cyclophilin family peptidyl-prolyl cis-trans isomerase